MVLCLQRLLFFWKTNGRVFIQSWRWDPPKLSRKIPSFCQNDFGKFLSGGYPNRSSGIHRWGLDLSTGYPNTYFSWFSGYPQLDFGFSAGRRKVSDIFRRCLSRKSGSQRQLHIKTLPSKTHCQSGFLKLGWSWQLRLPLPVFVQLPAQEHSNNVSEKAKLQQGGEQKEQIVAGAKARRRRFFRWIRCLSIIDAPEMSVSFGKGIFHGI